MTASLNWSISVNGSTGGEVVANLILGRSPRIGPGIVGVWVVWVNTKCHNIDFRQLKLKS